MKLTGKLTSKLTSKLTGREIAAVGNDDEYVFLHFGRLGAVLSPDEASHLAETIIVSANAVRMLQFQKETT